MHWIAVQHQDRISYTAAAMAADNPKVAVQLATIFGNLSKLKEVERASGMDLRQVRGDKGRNLLHLAVLGYYCTGELDLCRYLVEEKGFDVNSTSDEGETAIFVATETPWLLDGVDDAAAVAPLLTYFLDRGVDPAVPNDSGLTPLHNAAGYGNNEAIVLLLSRGIPVDPFKYDGTPLLTAARNGRANTIKILLEHGADPNRVANRVYSPLVMACIGGSLECVKLLLEAGANVNFHSHGMTMGLAAVGSRSAEIVKVLLEAGADPNIHDGYGRFPIIQAAAHEQREIVEILLPRTNPIPYLPDWSVDGIIRTMKTLPRELYVEPFANAMSEGREAFANGDYGYAMYCFSRASVIDPDDATVHANLSLCFLKMRSGMQAVHHAKECQRLRPRWAKAWFREGEALSLLKKHGETVTAFQEALRLDPGSIEIKDKLREAKEALSKQVPLS